MKSPQGDRLALFCKWLFDWRWPLAAIWLLILGACLLRLSTVPMGNTLTELKGATQTEAYQVEQIMQAQFGYRPDSTAALVIMGPRPQPELKAALLKNFSEIREIQDQPGRKDKNLRCWFLFFDTQIPFAQTQVLVNKIRHFLTEKSPTLGIKTYLSGNAAFYNDFLEASKADATTAELLALFFAFGVLLFTFGGLVSALLPLMMGVTTLLLFNCFLNLFQIQITPVSLLLTSILGLALSIDYAFFLVSRYQEEWDKEPVAFLALSRTLKATGKTVLVSGLLVVLSTAALLLPNLSVQRTNAFNLVCVAAVATLNALFFLPGLLILTSPFLGWPKQLSQRFRSPKKHLFWQKFARHVVERPKRYFAFSLLILLGLASPVLHIRLWDPIQTMAPEHSESMQGYQLLQKDGWGGLLLPLHLIVEAPEQAPLDSPTGLSYLYDLTQAMAEIPGVAIVQGPMPYQKGISKAESIRLYQSLQTTGLLFAPGSVSPKYVLLNIQQTEMMDILKSYELIAQAQNYARLHPQYKVRVGGVVARSQDFIRELYAYTPQILLLVSLSILVVLMVYMKSLILPIKASVMNFLPIMSAYGILVLIFQDGFLSEFLHLPHQGAIGNLVPLTLFGLIFGLSMDYEILIMSRISEVYESTGNVAESIIEGLARSSSVITGAALILIMVFLPGLFSQSAIMKEVSLGIIAALVIDATLVRLFLVPSFMMLMGHWNWWNPFKKT